MADSTQDLRSLTRDLTCAPGRPAFHLLCKVLPVSCYLQSQSLSSSPPKLFHLDSMYHGLTLLGVGPGADDETDDEIR